MKRLLIFYFFLQSIQSFGQGCDSTITIVKSMKYVGSPTQLIGIEVDSIRNGLLVTRSQNGTVFEQNYYDSLNRLTSRSYILDSTTFAYDTSSRLIRKDYFMWQGTGWQYKSDTAKVEYYFSGLLLDSIIKFQWDGSVFNPFYRYRQFYNSNDTLINWQIELFNNGQWTVDSIAIVSYAFSSTGFTRVDSVFSDSINSNLNYELILYDSLERIIDRSEMFGMYPNGFYRTYEYECSQLSGYHQSCYGCRSGSYSNFTFDSSCRIQLNYFGHYSMSGDDQTYINEYYYAGCSTLVLRLPGEQKICKGDSIQISALSFGGTAPYQIHWNPTHGLDNDTSYSIMASPDSSITYVVTVTDSNGLSANDTIHINVVKPPIANIFIESFDSASICQSAVLSADSLQGYNVFWKRDSIFLGYGFHQNIVYNGTYIIEVSLGWPNVGTCPVANDTLVFNGFSQPPPIPTLSRGCNEIYVSRSDPYSTVQWFFNNQAIADSSRDTLVVTQNGTYGVLLSDSSGCSANSITTIYYQNMQANLTGRKTCIDSCNGSLTIQQTNHSYLWSNGATTNQITNLCNGIYSVLVTDFYGCTVSLSDTIVDFQPAVISYLTSGTSSATTCDGMVIAVDSTNTPLNAIYVWEDNSNGPFLDSLCSGWHTVTVSPRYSYCPQIDSFFIAPALSNDTCSILYTASSPNCTGNFNGSITVSSSTGSPFACIWYSANSITNFSLTRSYLGAGTYSCMMIDQNGCVDSIDILLSDPLPITATLTSMQNTCQDSCLITAIASGGTAPYTYNWTSGQNGSQIYNCSEICIVNIRDSYNCLLRDTIHQASVSPLILTTINVPTTCPTCNDGYIIPLPSGGVPPYSYSVDGGSTITVDTITGLSSGTHSICLIGSNNCSTCKTTQILLNTYVLSESKLILAYPNPFHDRIQFLFEEYKPGIETRLTVLDIFGRLVKDIPVRQPKFELTNVGMQAGMYIYELRVDNLVRDTGKLIVE
jgi:hypothetical protein